MRLTFDQVKSVWTKALAAGATRHGLFTVEWDVSGGCLNPSHVELHARRDRRRRRSKSADLGWWLPPGSEDFERLVVDNGPTKEYQDRASPPGFLCVELWTRCRRCLPCRKAKAMLWRERAREELAASARSWIGCLTFSPEAYAIGIATAHAKLAKSGVDLATLGDAEQQNEVIAALNPQITRWLKRVRKVTGAPLRYLLVWERGETEGRLHAHILLHEQDRASPVRKLLLEAQWKGVGHSHWRLVHSERGAAGYLTEYISKEMLARVRASFRYGKNCLTTLAPTKLDKAVGARACATSCVRAAARDLTRSEISEAAASVTEASPTALGEANIHGFIARCRELGLASGRASYSLAGRRGAAGCEISFDDPTGQGPPYGPAAWVTGPPAPS